MTTRGLPIREGGWAWQVIGKQANHPIAANGESGAFSGLWIDVEALVTQAA